MNFSIRVDTALVLPWALTRAPWHQKGQEDAHGDTPCLDLRKLQKLLGQSVAFGIKLNGWCEQTKVYVSYNCTGFFFKDVSHLNHK